jgi:hypothetical protein
MITIVGGNAMTVRGGESTVIDATGTMWSDWMIERQG